MKPNKEILLNSISEFICFKMSMQAHTHTHKIDSTACLFSTQNGCDCEVARRSEFSTTHVLITLHFECIKISICRNKIDRKQVFKQFSIFNNFNEQKKKLHLKRFNFMLEEISFRTFIKTVYIFQSHSLNLLKLVIDFSFSFDIFFLFKL